MAASPINPGKASPDRCELVAPYRTLQRMKLKRVYGAITVGFPTQGDAMFGSRIDRAAFEGMDRAEEPSGRSRVIPTHSRRADIPLASDPDVILKGRLTAPPTRLDRE